MALTEGALIERALAAHIRGERDPNADDSTFAGQLDLACTRTGTLNGVNVHEARQGARVQSPCIMVSCANVSTPFWGAPFRQCSVEVLYQESRREDSDDTQQAEVIFNERVDALTTILSDEQALATALSKPADGSVDGREITGIHVPLINISDEALAADADVWQWTLTLTADVYAFDFTPF